MKAGSEEGYALVPVAKNKPNTEKRGIRGTLYLIDMRLD